MKNLLKISFLLILTISFNSWSEESFNDEINSNKFDYSLFNSLKGIKVDIDYPESIKNISSIIEKNRAITNHINSELGVNLNLTNESVEYAAYNTDEIIEIGLREGFFEEHDKSIILQLDNDLSSLDFENSIQNFETKVLTLNLSSSEFEKYNTWANILKLINQENPNALVSNYQQKGCLGAILAYSGATVAVGVACVPNPTTPIACPLAIALKSLAYFNMIDACNEEEE